MKVPVTRVWREDARTPMGQETVWDVSPACRIYRATAERGEIEIALFPDDADWVFDTLEGVPDAESVEAPPV